MSAHNIPAPPAADNEYAPLDAHAALTRPPSFAGLERITASVDMLGWYWRYGLNADEKRRFEALTGRRIVNRPSPWGGWLVRIANPHQHLDTFLEWTAQRGIPINLVHVAFDLKCDDAAGARRAARNHLVLANAPNAHKFPAEEAARKGKHKRKLVYDENGLRHGGDFYFKDFRQPTDEDGERVGPQPGIPARFGRVYLRGGGRVLRIELCFKGTADLAKHLPPLHMILDTDPREIFVKNLRWRTYRPRLLAKRMRAQAAGMTWGKPRTGTWEAMLCNAPPRIVRMTTAKPLDLDVTIVWS